jgi:hypothetical protein
LKSNFRDANLGPTTIEEHEKKQRISTYNVKPTLKPEFYNLTLEHVDLEKLILQKWGL